MTDTSLFETFLLKTHSLEGCSVVVGGICHKGKKQEAVKIYSQIENVLLAKSKDEFLIDVILSDSLKKLTPEWVIILGASIHVNGIKKASGGIIGNPLEENRSSDEEIEEVFPGLHMITMPGGPGIVFAGSHSDGIKIKEMIIKNKNENSLYIDNIINKLDTFSNLYIIVQDGSGSFAGGGIYASDNYGKYFEII